MIRSALSVAHPFRHVLNGLDQAIYNNDLGSFSNAPSQIRNLRIDPAIGEGKVLREGSAEETCAKWATWTMMNRDNWETICQLPANDNATFGALMAIQ